MKRNRRQIKTEFLLASLCLRSVFAKDLSTKPLIGWWDYGVALTLTNGNTFTVDIDQVNGILTIT